MPDNLLDKAEFFFLEQLPDAVSRQGNSLVLLKPIPVSLKTFLDTINLPDAAVLIPDDLNKLTALQLDAFSVGTEGTVDFTISLQAGTDDRWVIMPGFVELDHFSMQLSIDQHALGPAIYGQLDVELNIAGFDVQATLNVPDLLFAARVKPSGNPPTAGDLFKALGIQQDAGFGKMTLGEVSIAGSAQTQYLFFALSIGDPWRLEGEQLDFVVEEIGLELMYVGGDGGSITGAVNARATLGKGSDPILFNVSAIYEGEGVGWTFAGSAENITMDDPVETVLGAFGIHTDSPFGNVDINRIDLEFNTLSKDFRFGFDGEIDFEGNKARMIAVAQLTQQPGAGYAKFFSGQLFLGEKGKELQFDLVFDQDKGGATLVGAFSNSGGQAVPLDRLVGSVAGDAAGNAVKDFDFKIKDALFAYQTGGKYLFTMNMDAGVELSALGSLPVIGAALPKDLSLSLEFQPIVSSKGRKKPDPADFQSLLPTGGPVLPEKLDGSGFQLLATLNVAGERHLVTFGKNATSPKSRTRLTAKDAGNDLGTTTTPEPAVSGANSVLEMAPRNVQFINIEKSFGPLHIQRVGLSLGRDKQEKQIGLVFDGAISIQGLTLALEGLGATYSLANKELQFFLRGMGIEFNRGPIEIAGGFLNTGKDFAGKVKISTKTFEITALGAFATVQGQPSLFIYGLLDYPLGGPPFFFIEGLAVGFGYNRSFQPPTITAVRQFPLVADVLEGRKLPAGADAQTTITNQLQKLSQYIQPSLGEYFFTAGIKFTSFKLLNSFILVAVSFGKSFELNILGVSTYQNPPVPIPSIPVLARIEMNLLGRFAPDEGFLGVQAQLTDRSFLISESCKITGGFAFFTWFDPHPNAGDFVLSVGGYHPRFNKPSHYPDVPRLGLNFQITENIYIKGSAYFALTPTTLMAGGAVEAHADLVVVAAWFSASLDMLISWEPYHYDFSIDLRVGARFGALEFEVGAHLEIWGPEFSGMASVDITVLQFDVEFGESTSRGPVPIGWEAFKEAFLPLKKTEEDAANESLEESVEEPAEKEYAICSIRIVQGIVHTLEVSGADVNVINPKDLKIATSSAIPALTGFLNDEKMPEPAPSFGVAPMDLHKVDTAEHRITITRKDEEQEKYIPVSPGELKAEKESRLFPKGMWGQEINVDMNEEESMLSAIAGYTLSVSEPTSPGSTRQLSRETFDHDVTRIPDENAHGDNGEVETRIFYSNVETPPANRLEQRRSRIKEGLADNSPTGGMSRRNAILSSLGIEPAEAVSLTDHFTDTFVIPPQVVSLDLEDA